MDKNTQKLVITRRVQANFTKLVVELGGAVKCGHVLGISRQLVYYIQTGQRSPSLELIDHVLAVTGRDLTKPDESGSVG